MSKPSELAKIKEDIYTFLQLVKLEECWEEIDGYCIWYLAKHLTDEQVIEVFGNPYTIKQECYLSPKD